VLKNAASKTLLFVPALLLAGILVAIAWWMFGEYLSREGFNAELWKGVKADQDVRIRMVDDLLKTKNFYGMTREQVIGILGPPENESLSGWEMVYLLGRARNQIGVDWEWLCFNFSDEGRVVAYTIVRDG
jgi:hypothetical protein